MQALISIHDVMPETLDQVQELIDCLPLKARPNTLLLVVPGRDWQPTQIEQLRHWQQQGFELVGHGWSHRAPERRSLYHRLHSAVISRDAAEHLSQNRRDLVRLLSRCHQWFEHWALAPPRTYVPPAWALGALKPEDLQTSPFQFVETTFCIYCSRTQRRRYLPLLGFEADSRFQASMLRLWNRMNTTLAGPDRPPRLALHPQDLRLKLSADLYGQLARLTTCLRFEDVI